jgi:arylsulfatase
MLAVLRGQTKKPLHKALFWDDGADKWAVRAGKWKLISRNGSLELYNLDIDISETKNLAAEYPNVLRQLKALHEKWKAQMRQPVSRQKKGTRKTKKNRSKQK